jgi:hypothetical protein
VCNSIMAADYQHETREAEARRLSSAVTFQIFVAAL